MSLTQVDPAFQCIHETVRAIQAWPHWDEIACGTQKEYNVSQEEFYQLLPEFQRFMALATYYPGLGMLSDSVDQIWHALILNTVRYREFCQAFMGRFVDHLPCSSYELYSDGISSSSCTMPPTPPSSCTDPYPAPPDPSPVPPKRHEISTTILEGSSRFVTAYTAAFGHKPDVAIWQRAPQLVDGLAL